MVFEQITPPEQAPQFARAVLGPVLLAEVCERAIADHVGGDPRYCPPVYAKADLVRVTDWQDFSGKNRWDDDCEIEVEYSPRGARAIYGINTDDGSISIYAD